MSGTSTMRLFGGFQLQRNDHILDVPLAAQRLFAFLALNERRLPRSYVADTLWPDVREEKAHANLRTSLWRLRRLGPDLVDVSPAEVGLSSSLRVDARLLHDAARDYREHGTLPRPELLLETRGELLPGCWDSWVVFDRERLRQESVQLHEELSRAELERGDYHLALLLGLGAVECDPLRESANVLAVRACLAGGDLTGAVRYARSYARLLKDELGVDPPAPLADLLWSHHRRRRDSRLPGHSVLARSPA